MLPSVSSHSPQLGQYIPCHGNPTGRSLGQRFSQRCFPAELSQLPPRAQGTGRRRPPFPGLWRCSLPARNNGDWFLDSRFPAWSWPRGHTPVAAPAWRARATKACTFPSQSPLICLWPALPISGLAVPRRRTWVCVQEKGQEGGSCASGTLASRMTLCTEKTGSPWGP